MLLALDTTSKSIEAKTSGTSGDVVFVATYADSASTSFVEGSNEGSLNTTDTIVVAAPASATRRVVKAINFFNTTATSRTVTLLYNNNGTKRTLVVISLDGQSSWSMDDLSGGGGGISSLAVGTTPVTGTNGRILYVNGAVLGELATTGSGSVVLATSPTLVTPLITTSLDATSSTFNLLNSVPTSINFGAAATSFNIGGATSAVLNLASGSNSVVNLGGGANAAELRFLEPSASGTNYTALKAQAQAANVTYTLPAADGSSGQVLATNGSGVLSWAAGGGGSAFKNVLHNGDFRIAQRGAGPFTADSSPTEFRNTDDSYQLDRWILLSDGNDTVDVSQSTTSPPLGRLYSLALDVETVNRKFGIAQIIERNDCQHMIGGTVSLSFKARVSSTTKLDKLRAAVVAWNGTADTVTSDIVSAWNAEDTNPTLITNCQYQNTPATLSVSNTSWNTYTINNISVASTFNSLDVKNLIVFIWSDVTDTTLGDFLYITDVQLETGASATEYEYIPDSIQLYRCQRFVHLLGKAYTSTPTSGQIPICNGVARDFTSGFGFLIIRPIMRAIVPSLVWSSLSHFNIYYNTEDQAALNSLLYFRPGDGGILLGMVKAALKSNGTATAAMSGGNPIALLSDSWDNARFWIIADM